MTHVRRNVRIFVSAAAALFPLAAAVGPVEAVETCDTLPATLVGSSFADVLQGTSAADVIVGLGGDDEIYGGGGNDHICGGSGADTIDREAGEDRTFRGGRTGKHPGG